MSGSLDETTLGKQQGIFCRIVFTVKETAIAFKLLETVQIPANRMEEAEIVLTFPKTAACRQNSLLIYPLPKPVISDIFYKDFLLEKWLHSQC
jgi:hypothetical protein